VSIVRAGATMEAGLRQVCPNISIGKLLIQTDPRTSEPQLHYCKLPADISKRHVLLMDATIATGAATVMAIRVLLDHDVPEENIIMLCFLSTPQGLQMISSMFPLVRVVTSEVDWKGVNDKFWIIPGMGNFGDRYFGC
jgi:uridine kinase